MGKNKIYGISFLISLMLQGGVFAGSILDIDAPVKATQFEAEIGVNNVKMMTPLRTTQAIGMLGGNVTGQSSSVDNEIVLFSGITGKIIKRATTTGIVKSTSGVMGAAIAGTDYIVPAGSGAGLTGITASQVGAPSGSGMSTGTNTGDNATNTQYSGLVSNASHTGDATGATALTVVGINNTTLSGLATGILKNTITTGVPSIAVAGDFPTLNQNTTGNAATVTVNADLTGPITSAGNATAIASQTGTGSKFVVDTSPTIITPVITTSATVPLIIGGTSATSSRTYKTTTGVGAAGADHIFQVGNNGATEAMRILNSGDVSIGTGVTTGAQLVVKRAGALNLMVANTSAAAIGNISEIILNPSSTYSKIEAPRIFAYELEATGSNKAELRFDTYEGYGVRGTRMTIDGTGNVSIGTTTSSAQFHTTGTVRFQNFGAGTATFDANGNISSASDERLKLILGKFNSGLDEILQINPILHKWNAQSGMEGENTYAGFSAQNVAKGIPEAVSINGDGMLGVSDRVIIAALVNAVKELSKEVDVLKTKLALPVKHFVAVNTSLTNLVKTKDARTIEIVKPLSEVAYEVVEKEEDGKLISITQLKKGYWEDKDKNIFRSESQLEAERRRQKIINQINLN